MKIILVVLDHLGLRYVCDAIAAGLRSCGHQVDLLCERCLRLLNEAALRDMQADLLLVFHGRRFPGRCLRHASVLKAVWLVDEPQEVDISERYARYYDIVLTNDVNTCGIHGPAKSWYLPLAANPAVDRPGPTNGLEIVDVTFVGVVHPQRMELLNRAIALTPDLTWRIVGPPGKWARERKTDCSFADVWQTRPVPHERYIEYVRASRVVLDIPRNPYECFAGQKNSRGIPATSVSPRVFETTAAGAFLLTSDDRTTIFDLYPEGEVGVYRHGDAADLAQQLRYYLEHEDERREMAEAARSTCLEKHTYAERAKKLTQIVEQWKSTRLPAGKATK